jgi:hypothetical protein
MTAADQSVPALNAYQVALRRYLLLREAF